MNIACPECSHAYRLDPARVGGGEVRTRCRECDTPFVVPTEAAAEAAGVIIDGRRVAIETRADAPAAAVAPPGSDTATDHGRATERAGATADAADPADTSSPPAERPPAFGPQDPQTRARRLARALVSDIKVYNQQRWAESRAKGSLRKDFRDEILKSWDEYVQQVGERMAKGTPYFRDALNDILGEGQRVF